MSSEALNRSAAEALEAARQHLDDLSERAFPGHREREAVADNDAARWDQARFERLSNLCAAAHIAVENSIKAHISAIAHKRFKFEHRIEVLLRELPAPTRDEFQRRIAPLAPDDIDPWRSAATYPAEEQSRIDLARITPEFAADLYEAAIACCEFTAAEIAAQPTASDQLLVKAREVQEIIGKTRDRSYHQQVRSENPFAVSTYTDKDIEPHLTAIPEPMMPQTGDGSAQPTSIPMAPPEGSDNDPVSAPQHHSATDMLTSLLTGSATQRPAAFSPEPLPEPDDLASATPKHQQTIPCRRTVPSTGNPCILYSGHDGHCRSTTGDRDT